MGLLTMLSILFGCSKMNTGSDDNVVESGIIGNDYSEDGPGEYKRIKSFAYNVSGYCPGFTCDIHPHEKKPEKTVMQFVDGDNGFKETNKTLDDHTVEQLSKLCEKLNVLSWDKFNQCDTNVLDGSGFMLFIEFEDGTTVSAQGENRFPKNYQEFEKSVKTILLGE